jgi:hypothetical protein
VEEKGRGRREEEEEEEREGMITLAYVGCSQSL